MLYIQLKDIYMSAFYVLKIFENSRQLIDPFMNSACVVHFHMLQHGQCMQPKHSLSSLIARSITMASNSELP